MTIRKLTADDVCFETLCEVEQEPIEGNCSAIDDETDRATEDWIRDQLDRGNEWAWCVVTVRASWGEFTGRSVLGGCSFRSEEDFRVCGYYGSICQEALEDLNNQVACADATVAPRKRFLTTWIGELSLRSQPTTPNGERTMSNRLEARVRAANQANQAAMELFPKLRDALAPFVGKPVVKATGHVRLAVKAALPPLPCTPLLNSYPIDTTYSLAWGVKACVVADGIAQYHEVALYVGKLRDGVLFEFHEAPQGLRTDYTAEEIYAKREVYRRAKQVADDAESALFPFGEYDL